MKVFLVFLIFLKVSTFVEGHVGVKYVDLSYSMGKDTLIFPGQRQFELRKDYEDWNVGMFAAYSFCLAEHGGTHIDAPYHTYKSGWTVDQIPPENLINVPGVIIDVRKNVEILENPAKFALSVRDLINFEADFGRIPHRAVVFVFTGWSRFWPEADEYFGFKNDSNGLVTANFPGISVEAGKWLYNERQIVGLGIDTPSIDVADIKLNATKEKTNKSNHPLHLYLSSKQVYNLENVANLHLLVNETGNGKGVCEQFRFHIMPLKIISGTGAPVQILGFCDTCQSS